MSYDAILVVLSISVAIMGSFTGLVITSRASSLSPASYKLKIVLGAAAIGSSIWSMHFIGMLALSAPVPLSYDSLVTTISVFIAIALTGLGLYAASSGHIGRGALPAGGLLMGSGIAGMHYLGMSAIRATCTVSYDPFGVAASLLAGIGASTLALRLSFRERAPLETVSAAVVLGLAISSMHYIAMLATAFSQTAELTAISGPVLSQHSIAFIVAIATFVICGLFLVMALPDKKRAESEFGMALAALAVPAQSERTADESALPQISPPGPQALRIPVRRNQSTFFAAPDSILAVRAEGHYSWIALKSKSGGVDEFFCDQPISALAKLLEGKRFVRSHRSHLVNIEHVVGYRRQGDGGLLFLDEDGALSIPVSRGKVQDILKQLEGRSAGGDVAALAPA